MKSFFRFRRVRRFGINLAIIFLISGAWSYSPFAQEPDFSEYYEIGQRPDFYLKLVQSFLWKPGEPHDRSMGGDETLLEMIASYGTWEMSSEELWEVDAEVRRIISKLAGTRYVNHTEDYDIFPMAGDFIFTAWMHYGDKMRSGGNARPVLILDHRLLGLYESEDELAFVLAHELAERIRFDSIQESRLKRTVVGQAKEYQCDALAAQMLAEAGYDPNAGADFYHKVMKMRPTRKSETQERLPDLGLSSHPPNEARIAEIT